MRYDYIERRHIEGISVTFTKVVTEAADENVGKKIFHSGRKRTIPWWTDNMKDAVG